jgi:hypothetical protein
MSAASNALRQRREVTGCHVCVSSVSGQSVTWAAIVGQWCTGLYDVACMSVDQTTCQHYLMAETLAADSRVLHRIDLGMILATWNGVVERHVA